MPQNQRNQQQRGYEGYHPHHALTSTHVRQQSTHQQKLDYAIHEHPGAGTQNAHMHAYSTPAGHGTRFGEGSQQGGQQGQAMTQGIGQGTYGYQGQGQYGQQAQGYQGQQSQDQYGLMDHGSQGQTSPRYQNQFAQQGYQSQSYQQPTTGFQGYQGQSYQNQQHQGYQNQQDQQTQQQQQQWKQQIKQQYQGQYSQLSTKDFNYLKDHMSWELLAAKKCFHYAQEAENPQVANLLTQVGRMHERHFDTLLQYFNPQNVQ